VPRPAPPPSPLITSRRTDRAILTPPRGNRSVETWSVPGGRVPVTTIVDFEYAWNLSHEDFPTITELVPPT